MNCDRQLAKLLVLESDTPELDSQLHGVPALSSWACRVISLKLHFPLYKWGILLGTDTY